ncbi:MAG: hypothetical protein JJU08_00670 [Rhodobacteraceae bacterium]|nr:hypothetical protein [Paracoccaceae bacterium]
MNLKRRNPNWAAHYPPALILAGVVAGLAGCMTLPKAPHELQAEIARAEWAIVPAANAWVHVPEARLVMERRAGGLVEQRIALPNATVLQGDNFIFLRAITSGSPGVIRLERVLEQAGGLPYPFSQDDLSAMRGRTDSAGALSWAEWGDGAGTSCVLALRRLGVGARVLPGQASAIDMVLRNCVRGEADAALAPAAPDAVAFSAQARPSGDISQRNLSPLAAPAP